MVLGLLEAPLFQWIFQIDDYNPNSLPTLSIIKVGPMSSPREAELQSLLPGNITNLLSLQETPLGCSSRMPGNFNMFNGFLNGSSQMINKTSLAQDMHNTQSNRQGF